MYVALAVALVGPIGFFVGPLSHEKLFVISGFTADSLKAFVTEELLPDEDEYKDVEVHIGLSATLGFLVGLGLFHYFKRYEER